MNDHDKAARFAFRRIDEAGMLRWHAGEATWAAWQWTGWLDSQAVPFPGEPDRRMDTVATFERVAGDEPPLAVVFEFLTKPSGDIFERLAEYALRVRRELPYQAAGPRVPYVVIGRLVLLTGAIDSGAWGMRPPDAGGLGLSVDCGVINLSREDARLVLAGVEAGTVARAVLAWMPLMKHADDPAVVAEWARLATAEPDDVRRGSIGGIARAFARLTSRELVWTPVLEGWNVERSPVFMEWEAMGELKNARSFLLRVLSRRLNQEMPLDVKLMVQQQKDLGKLTEWIDSAATVADLDEARRFLGLA